MGPESMALTNKAAQQSGRGSVKQLDGETRPAEQRRQANDED